MSRELNLEVKTFKSGGEPKSWGTAQVSLSLVGSDIMNYLQLHKKVEVPPKYFLLMEAHPNPTQRVFKILDDSRSLSNWEKMRPVVLWLCPPTLRINIVSPDGQRKVKDCDSRKPAHDAVCDFCQMFGLKDDLAYALYSDPNDMLRPIMTNKAICEVDPAIGELYLQRRYWLKALNDYADDRDVEFNFAQAERMVYDPSFDPSNHDIENLIAISLTLKYERQQAVEQEMKKIKKEKKKNRPELLQKLFPPYLCDKKNKARRKKIIEAIAAVEGQLKKDLKIKFIRTCLKDQFFGFLMFKVKCVVPNSGNPALQEVLYTINEDATYLLDKDTKATLLKIPNSRIRSSKPTPGKGELVFSYKNQAGAMASLAIQHPDHPRISDYFTGLMNYLKKQKLAEQTDEVQRDRRRAFTTTTNTTLNDLAAKDKTLTAPTMFGSEPSVAAVLTSSASLPSVDPPTPQNIEPCALDSLDLRLEAPNFLKESQSIL